MNDELVPTEEIVYVEDYTEIIDSIDHVYDSINDLYINLTATNILLCISILLTIYRKLFSRKD